MNVCICYVAINSGASNDQDRYFDDRQYGGWAQYIWQRVIARYADAHQCPYMTNNYNTIKSRFEARVGCIEAEEIEMTSSRCRVRAPGRGNGHVGGTSERQSPGVGYSNDVGKPPSRVRSIWLHRRPEQEPSTVVLNLQNHDPSKGRRRHRDRPSTEEMGTRMP